MGHIFTARKRSLRRLSFARCLSVHGEGSWSLSRGLCPEVSVQVGLCPGSVSVQGGLCLEGSLSRVSMSREVSVQWELLCPGDLCLGGLCPGRVSVFGSLSGEGLCLGSLCPGDGPRSGGNLCPGSLAGGISVQGVSVQGGLCPGGLCLGVSVTETPCYGNVRAVGILLEYILVNIFSC